MSRALWTAATGMHAQQTNVDAIAHDLSNVNTAGYKKTRVNFADLFYQRVRAAGMPGIEGNNLPSGLQIGTGVRVTGTTKQFTIGGALETGNGLNMMIQDNGGIARNFFPVRLADGSIAYTRDGSFTKDSEGNIVLPTGVILDGGITLPEVAQDIFVSPEGEVFYNDEAGDQQSAGQFQIATFANPAGLAPLGDNLFGETDSSGTATLGTPGDDGFGEIRSGYIEISNVSAIEEMVSLISAQRAYEFNSRSIQTSDEMLQTVNNLKR
ncbi:MAG: flagellar basal-body rod protein FlgG [Planctomycetes bacterium]|nr:flagellar basal-body rod protein FlgG [Planctomycetota bacterium]